MRTLAPYTYALIHLCMHASNRNITHVISPTKLPGSLSLSTTTYNRRNVTNILPYTHTCYHTFITCCIAHSTSAYLLRILALLLLLTLMGVTLISPIKWKRNFPFNTCLNAANDHYYMGLSRNMRSASLDNRNVARIIIL